MSRPFPRPADEITGRGPRKRSSADAQAPDAGRAHRALAEMVERTRELIAFDDARRFSWWPV